MRPVIIGAGHNGLVAAAYLARAGRKPLVLERRSEVGGCAVTHEIHPGFRAPALAHAGVVRDDIARDLGLEQQGLHVVRPETTLFAPSADGRALILSRDPRKTSQALAAWSPKDAERWPEFQAATDDIARVLDRLLRLVPPSIGRPSPSELWDLLRLGKDIRGLGRERLYQVLRWGPMAVADFAAEWCETPLLRAVVAARGTFGANAGPWSAGTTLGWMLQAASERHPAGAPSFVVGGPGSLAAALAVVATSAGAEIRTNAGVARIEVDDSGVTAVVLESGESIATDTVLSNADPKCTLLGLVDPMRLTPSFLQQIRNYRTSGVTATVNFALDGLPAFTALAKANVAAETALAGRIHIGPDVDYIERAFDCSKYGRLSDRPWLEAVIPSLSDSTLAPVGKHVMSVYVQWAPHRLREGDWDQMRESLGDLVVRTLAEYAPDLPRRVLAGEVITPLDLERTYGLTGGQIFHGEHSLDQIFTMRPVIGWAQHRTPIRGLYLCGAGTHPGGGLSGAPGAHAARVVLSDRS